jgi:hypothetical protein
MAIRSVQVPEDEIAAVTNLPELASLPRVRDDVQVGCSNGLQIKLWHIAVDFCRPCCTLITL